MTALVQEDGDERDGDGCRSHRPRDGWGRELEEDGKAPLDASGGVCPVDTQGLDFGFWN